ncbi:hypothetical protein KM043_006252 [Ampulex compressa]|nr:hypothetical protein KM043_006252 [Ampulex compressa]
MRQSGAAQPPVFSLVGEAEPEGGAVPSGGSVERWRGSRASRGRKRGSLGEGGREARRRGGKAWHAPRGWRRSREGGRRRRSRRMEESEVGEGEPCPLVEGEKKRGQGRKSFARQRSGREKPGPGRVNLVPRTKVEGEARLAWTAEPPSPPPENRDSNLPPGKALPSRSKIEPCPPAKTEKRLGRDEVPPLAETAAPRASRYGGKARSFERI